MSIQPLLIEPRPVVPLPGHWTFWADTMPYIDLPNVNRQPVPLGPVDVSGFGYTSRLSGFGSGTATLSLPCGIDPARLLRLWSWRLWCFYEGSLVWCGVPSGISDEDAAARVHLTLTELPGYLTKRVFDWWPKVEHKQVEQTVIARDLASVVTQVGVEIVTQAGPGVLRDRTYQYLESDSRGQLLANLASVAGGPEFRTEYRMGNDGQPVCTLRIAYPRVGSGLAGLGVTIPGGALGYRAQWDADRMRTWTFAVGDLPENAEPEAAKPTILAQRSAADLPRLDAVDDWPGTFLESTLRERAETMADQQLVPALTLSASPPASYPPLSQYTVGDDVTVNAVTPLLPGGLTVTGRLAELSVSAGGGTAAWSVVTSMPPPQARATIAGRLARTDTSLSQQFHAGRLGVGWRSDAEDAAARPQAPPEVGAG